MRKAMLFGVVSLAFLSGCSHLTVETLSGYKVSHTRFGFIPRQYMLQDFNLSTSNMNLHVGSAVSATDTNGAAVAKDMAGAATEGAVRAILKQGR